MSEKVIEAHNLTKRYDGVPVVKGVTFSTIRAVSGRGTAPQVFIGGRHIGGADDLEAYFTGQQKRAA